MAFFSRRVALTGSLASCALLTLGSHRLPARAQSLQTLRIAYQPYQYSAQVLFAQEMGFFTEAGISAQLQQMAYGSALAGAVAAGAVDIGLATVATVAQARHRNVPFVIVAGAALFSANSPPKVYPSLSSIPPHLSDRAMSNPPRPAAPYWKPLPDACRPTWTPV